jgi:hypothetical protein
VVEAEELEFLQKLAQNLELSPGKADSIIEVMDILHRDALATSN